jgi:hypothetical protein
MTDSGSTARPRGEPLWRLHKEGTTASCELMDPLEDGVGWTLIVRVDDDVTGTRRYDSERITRYYADALRQDYLRDGWTE